MELASVSSNDFLVDLGCGEGTFLIQACKQAGCKGLGLEIEPEFVKTANQNALEAKLENLVQFEVCDFIKDAEWMKKATVAYIYGAPRLYNNKEFMKHLQDFRENYGGTVICYYFGMDNWSPFLTNYDDTFKIFVYKRKS
jgi:tRNA/tmRNA/rRNA uracil-C5-methylase (TrmA/RlmC/RlmD family)